MTGDADDAVGGPAPDAEGGSMPVDQAPTAVKSGPIAVAAAYGALKRDLVVRSGGDWAIYTDGKSAFVADVVGRARRAKAGKA